MNGNGIMKLKLKQEQDVHAQQHWQGNIWGEDGVVCQGLFKLLSTLITARKSAPTWKHKFLVLTGIVQIYLIIRSGYSLEHMNAGQLDILASASRGLRQHKHAIKCGKLGLSRLSTDGNEKIDHTTHMLLLKGLMRDHDAVRAADQPGSRVHDYFAELRNHFEDCEYDPPEQKIRICRALAWFTNKYSARDYGYGDAKRYVAQALTLAQLLGAKDQEDAIKREFEQLL